MKKYIIIFFILLFTIFISNVMCYAKRYALVIGNGSYKNVPLNNPVNDANDIANILQELDFDVSKKTNASKQEIINSIRNFENKITSADVALFYYSGHGLQVNGINYIIPIGADITAEDEIEFEAVAMNRIMSKLEKARINIIILDACRDNPYKGFRSAEKGLAILTSKTEGTFIAYSTAPGKVAVDGTGRNSPYTKNLIEKIKIPDLEIEDVFKEVRKVVKQETNNKQIPWDSSSLTDDFIFAMSCAPKPTEPKQEIEVETEYTYGQIKVESNIDGSVYLDNEYVCSISAGSIKTLKNVITGSHTVKVKTDDVTKSKNITVNKDKTSQVNFAFKIVYPHSSDIPRRGLIAEYLFNGNANDESGNGNDGIVYGATLTEDKFGNPNSAYSFDGVDDYIEFTNSILIDEDFTVSSWIFIPDFQVYHEYILSKHITHYNWAGGWILADTYEKLDFGHYGNRIQHIISNDVLFTQENHWYQIAITYNDPTDEYKMYFDGFEIQSGITNINISMNNVPLRAGCASVSATNPVGFSQIIIDDIRIYSRALSETEIDLLYHEGGWKK